MCGSRHSQGRTAHPPPQQFELVPSYMLDNGLQAIVIKPSAPFSFLKLPAHLRARILRLDLTPTTNKGRIH
jgi:hypothetical protein